jgi:hypothetical protein
MLRLGAQTRVLLCLFFAIVGVSAGAGLAWAEAGSAVVVIDSGTADLFIDSLVRTNAENELRKQGFRIVEGADVGGETPKKLLACAGDLPCSVSVLSGITAEYVIFISLRSDEKSGSANFKIVVRNYEVATGKALARKMRRCPECKEEIDLAGFTAQLIVELIRESGTTDPVEPPPPDPIEPVATVPPPQPVTGAIPVPLKVYQPGPGRGEKSGKSFELMGALKYVGLGLGTVAVATGTYLVLIDGPVIEDNVRQADSNDTLVPGFVTLGVGVAAIGLSAWLWASESDSRSATATHIVPTADGGAIVWSGGF